MSQKLFVYAVTPIDHWAGWSEPTQALSDFFDELNRPDPIERERYEDMLLAAQRLAHSLGWDGTFRDGPFVAGLPMPEADEFGFMIAWKQDNNGTTFVASPIPLPHLAGFGAKAEGVIG